MGAYGVGPYGAGVYGGTQIKFPDAMPDIKYWLKHHPYLATLSAGRVFFNIPPKVKTAPFIRIYRSGGGPQIDSEVPMSDLRLGIDVWGMSGRDYDVVRQTVLAIESAAHDLDPGTVLGPTGTVGQNISVTTALDTPDPDTGWPRIAMDVIFTVRV